MQEKRDELTERILGCAIAVHKELGPGLLESLYLEALSIELQQAGMQFNRQLELPVVYKGIALNGTLRVDILVENLVVLELKCVETILPLHCSQLLSYMKLGGWKRGLILNFKSATMLEGVKRMVL